MMNRSFLGFRPVSLVALLFPFIAHASELSPRIAGDFQSGAPALDVAPGEKRFTRSTLAGDMYNKHPYSKHPNAKHGRRFSLEAVVNKDGDGGPYIVPLTPLSTSALGALNPRSGTVAGWFQLGNQPGEILTGRGEYLKNYIGTASWELGISPEGHLYLQTIAGRLETKEQLPSSWVHVAAVWDADQGASIYLDGKRVATTWSDGQTSATAVEEEAPVYDSRKENRSLNGTVFSHGVGNGRGMVALAKNPEWGPDRVSLEHGGEHPHVSIVNESGSRIQMRFPKIPAPKPGRYELVVMTEGGETASLRPRIGIQQGGETRFAKISPGKLDFEILPNETEAAISVDLNFTGKGNWWVEGISIRPARGAVAAAKPAAAAVPAIERLVIHPRPTSALRALRVYDAPLSAAGVAALFEGRAPQQQEVEPSRINATSRLAMLGWNAPISPTLPVAQAEQPLRFRQAPVLEALEGMRAAGWLAVSGFPNETFPWGYHGYGQNVPVELKLKLEFAPNWMTGRGDAFRGKLQDGDSVEPLALNAPWFQQPLSGKASDLVFTRDDGALSRLEFYHVGQATGEFPKGSQFSSLQKGDGNLLPEIKEREMISAYPATDRQLFTPSHEVEGEETVSLPALATWHLATRPVEKEETLGGIGLRLRMAPLKEASRALLVVHDPYTPHRELARLECVLAPSPKGEYTIWLDLRESLLLPGSNVWVSVTLERDANLQIGNGGTELAIFPAKDAALAAERWKMWEGRSVRDRIERISEPRPWGDVGSDPESRWWLAGASVVYEQIDSMLERLTKRFPDDATFKAWYSFTHPQAPTSLDHISLPENGNHPEWAVLTRENLRHYRAFLDYWIDKRQHSNGEFGHFYGDDTDLVQDWLDMTLIADPRGKYTESLDRLARGIATTFRLTGGRDGPGGKQAKGLPIIKDGLNTRWTDILHAYEDGLNVQPPDFVANYGDPVRFQRLLDTVSRYDNFILTPEKDGVRRFALDGKGTGFINDKHRAGSADDKNLGLLLHAGLTTAWYNNDPEVWKMLEAVARGELQAGGPLRYSTGPLMQAMFRKTGNTEFLAPLFEESLLENTGVVKSNSLYANQYLRLARVNREATFAELNADAATRFELVGSHSLGWADNRHLKNWLEWQFSGKEESLLDGLRALHKQWVFLMPAYTEAEQSGDRVSPPKQLISQLYLGGVPGSRNRHFYPDFAVSYSGLDDNFAARVEENTPKSLRVRLYSFAEAPLDAKMGVWELEPGEYLISDGATEEKRFLRRGDHFPITLQPNKEVVYTVKQVAPGAEPQVLGDAAISVETIRREAGVLHVPVYNLGTVALEGVTVRLLDSEGKSVAEEKISNLPGVTNWKMGEKTLSFKNVTLKVSEVEVLATAPEITTRNNRVQLAR